MKNKILVVGGTGKTGRRVAQKLQEKDQLVRIGSRHQDPAFDWNEPSTYANALNGMDMAYVVYHPDLAVPGAKESIQAFAEALQKKRV